MLGSSKHMSVHDKIVSGIANRVWLAVPTKLGDVDFNLVYGILRMDTRITNRARRLVVSGVADVEEF